MQRGKLSDTIANTMESEEEAFTISANFFARHCPYVLARATTTFIRQNGDDVWDEIGKVCLDLESRRSYLPDKRN